MFLGIDLGTTNTVVSRSFMDSSDKMVTEVVRISQYHNWNWESYPLLPSMVYFEEECGKIVGYGAKDQRENEPDRVVSNAKRFMGTYHTWKIDGTEYAANDIAAMILKHCKSAIEKEANMNYEKVVITVPASFNPDQIEDTLKAAIQAGFKNEQISIKHEPTSALLSFIDSQSQKSKDDRYIDFTSTKRIMVFDLGGGTCDTSIIDVKVTGSEMVFSEVGIGRYQELGGIDFDRKLAEGLLNTYYQENNILEGDIEEEEKEELFNKLLVKAEKLKENISSKVSNALFMDESCSIEAIQVKNNIPNFYNGKPYRIALTKSQYDEYTESLYQENDIHYKKFEDMDNNKSIINVIKRTLEEYDIDKSSIDYVFMTGGMSQYHTVRERISEYIGKPWFASENPMEAVARGASIYPRYTVKMADNTKEETRKSTKGTTEDIGIVDTMMLAEAILLEMNEGLPRVIIPKQTVVPYSGEIKGEFKTASPSGIKLNIYAAEDPMDSSMRIQKSIEKPFKYPVKSGTPFDIEYTINENKAISMKLIVNDDMHRQVLDVSVRDNSDIQEKDYDIIMEE